MMLPSELGGERNLLAVAFRRNHQGDVDSWLEDFATAEAADPALRSYEIPVISRRWSPARGFIDGGMAANIRIPRVLARTITVYTNVSAFQKILGITDSDRVQACVVTPGGDVLARVPGEPTDSAWQAIAEALAQK